MKNIITLLTFIFALSGFAQSQAFLDKYVKEDGDKWSCSATCYVVFWGHGNDYWANHISSNGATASSALKNIQWLCKNYFRSRARAVDHVVAYGLVVKKSGLDIYDPTNEYRYKDIDQYFPTVKDSCVQNRY